MTTSHSYLYKKLDEFGKDHTKSITDAVRRQSELMGQKKDKQRVQECAGASQESVVAGPTQLQPSLCTVSQSSMDCGRKITFDNLDYYQEVHHMTEEHQNIDKHYVTVMSTENRVHGNHLSDDLPETGVLGMKNGKCLPSVKDNTRQRENYIVLTERIISSSIPCLHYLSKVCTPHIPHQYSKEMKNVSQTVSKKKI